MASLIEVRNLSVRFPGAARGVLAVRNVSFDVAKGETVALVGESGSGKTVSALSILRLLPPGAQHPTGEILFEGRDLLRAKEPEIRQVRGNRISIVFQEPMTSLNPLHTVEKQVSEVLKFTGACRTARPGGARLSFWKRLASAKREPGFPPIRTSSREASASAS